jgi:lipoate-protein ligase A
MEYIGVTMVRRIDIDDATIGTWGAVASLMRTQMRNDDFENTVVTLSWSGDQPSLALGNYEDADQLDVEQVRDSGVTAGRVYHSGGGGSGIFTPAIPLVLVYYEHDEHDKEENSLLKHFDELNGKANAAALQRVGLDGEYRSIGDAEVVLDDNRYKVMACAATNFPKSEYWAIVSSPIWGAPPQEYSELMDEAIDMPKEKFEDKDTDSLTSRMRPISAILDSLDKDVGKDELIDALVEENVKRLIGEDEDIVEEELSDEEATFIDDMVPFFESDPWIDRISISAMCEDAPDHLDVGIAAYKSRKLIKAGVIFNDDGTIYDVQFAGDFYFRPALPVTSTSVLDDLANAVKGLDPADEDALEKAVGEVFDRPELEFPRLNPSDFVQPITRATNNTQSVVEYAAEN